MKRVAPKDEVKKLRDHIKIQRINENKGKMLNSKAKQKLPDEMIRWLRIDKLKRKIQGAEMNVHDAKTQYVQSAKTLKENSKWNWIDWARWSNRTDNSLVDIKKIQLKKRVEELTEKKVYLKLKWRETSQRIEKEEFDGKQIDEVMPIVVKPSNLNDMNSSQVIRTAVDELKMYYENNLDDNGKSQWSEDVRQKSFSLFWLLQGNTQTQDKLMESLHQIFAGIPNFVLFMNLLREKDLQVAAIEKMANIDVNNLPSNRGRVEYKTSLSRLYAQHIGLEIDRRRIRREMESVVNDYIDAYNQFAENLRTTSDIDDDLLDTYLQQFSMNCYSKAQIEYLRQTIASVTIQSEQNLQMQNELQHTTKILQSTYNEIEQLYCTMRNDINALASVKEKLDHNQNTLRYLVQSKSGGSGSEQQAMNVSRASQNNSLASFNSTVDISMLNANDSRAQSRPKLEANAHTQLPQLVHEFNSFIRIPIGKLKNHSTVFKWVRVDWDWPIQELNLIFCFFYPFQSNANCNQPICHCFNGIEMRFKRVARCSIVPFAHAEGYRRRSSFEYKVEEATGQCRHSNRSRQIFDQR